MQIKAHYSLVVIGSGPAGVAAANTAARHGFQVAVFDEQRFPGGQIYRNLTEVSGAVAAMLGQDYCAGRPLLAQFQQRIAQGAIAYFNNASVWGLNKQRQLSVLWHNRSYQISADYVVLACGAQERPMPLPGWQLPGVMTVGAGQIMVKSAAMIPQGNVVLAGSGPLLLLLAWQYIRCGVVIDAIIDTTPTANYKAAFFSLGRALTAPEYLFRGIKLLHAIRRAGINVYKHAANLIAEGQQQLQQLRFQQAGKQQVLDATTLLLHQGIVPQLHLAMLADCEVSWNTLQHCWHGNVNRWGASSVDGLYLAGDSQAIVGANAATLHGQLCSLDILERAGRISRKQLEKLSRPARQGYHHHLAVRPFLDKLYKPGRNHDLPTDDTIVCRCEEVTAGEIRKLAASGCVGPNQAKAFSRCGMGPCQGRQCGLAVSAIIADVRHCAIAEVGYYRIRSPIKPITLSQMGGV